jgi:hypothetical protein
VAGPAICVRMSRRRLSDALAQALEELSNGRDRNSFRGLLLSLAVDGRCREQQGQLGQHGHPLPFTHLRRVGGSKEILPSLPFVPSFCKICQEISGRYL